VPPDRRPRSSPSRCRPARTPGAGDPLGDLAVGAGERASASSSGAQVHSPADRPWRSVPARRAGRRARRRPRRRSSARDEARDLAGGACEGGQLSSSGAHAQPPAPLFAICPRAGEVAESVPVGLGGDHVHAVHAHVIAPRPSCGSRSSRRRPRDGRANPRGAGCRSRPRPRRRARVGAARLVAGDDRRALGRMADPEQAERVAGRVGISPPHAATPVASGARPLFDGTLVRPERGPDRGPVRACGRWPRGDRGRGGLAARAVQRRKVSSADATSSSAGGETVNRRAGAQSAEPSAASPHQGRARSRRSARRARGRPRAPAARRSPSFDDVSRSSSGSSSSAIRKTASW